MRTLLCRAGDAMLTASLALAYGAGLALYLGVIWWSRTRLSLDIELRTLVWLLLGLVGGALLLAPASALGALLLRLSGDTGGGPDG